MHIPELKKLLATYETVVSALQKNTPAKILPFALVHPLVQKIDLSAANKKICALDYRNNDAMIALIDELVHEQDAKYGIGGYGEKRGWYARGEQFSQGEEIRSIHIGVDVWAPPGTPVYAPYDSTMHSFKNNDLLGDYGPTIILTHELSGARFHTLYGHLSLDSLEEKKVGQKIRHGEQIGAIGSPPSNGDWPPHIHFQIITDMLGKVGDYPGVAAESQKEQFMALCPDPNYILRSDT